VADPPATVAAGSGFTAMETLANRGPGRAAASVTRFYLSADGAKDPGDVLLGGSRSVPEMGSGESSQGATDLTVPASTRSGPYRLLACADDFSMLPETDETNNCLASAGTIQIPLPDLTESALADPPAAARAGDSITVSDAVTNAGGGASEAFVTSYLLSLDAVKGSGDVSLTGNRPISEVSAGAVSAGIVTVAVPASTLPGLYYLIGCADGGGVVTESNETNNCRSSAGRVQIPLPDLMESAVGDPPPSAPAGGSVTMSDTVLNQGGGAAGGSTTRYYLSLDSLKGSGDILLSGTRLVGGLDAGASGAGSATVAIPSATTVGPYYLLACADDTGAVAETSETDNCLAASQPIQVTKPDLAETAVPDPPATAAQGKAFSVTDTVRNQGAAAAGSSTTRYYLSLDTLKSSADKLLSGTRSISTLAAGASSTGTVTVTIPSSTAAGLYYLLACADDKSAVKESDETNNCLPAAGRVQVLVPDLTVAAVSDPPAAAVIGASFSASDTTLNQGAAASASSTTRYYLSLDMLKNSGDKLLSGTRSVPSLLPGAASPGTVTVTIPSSTAAGLYYLLACADDKAVLAESDETNNCRPSVGRIQVTVPDLVESAVSDPPVAVPVGTGFAVTDTALNQGTGIAAISTTRYYLSADTSKGSSDLLLTGSRSVPSLAPGTSSAGTASVTVPAGAAAGLYYLLACADDTSLVTESSNSNNCRASILRVSVS
jgi:subtilase family serine protease